MAKSHIPSDLQAWIDARKRHRLSDAHVQMARELGMNPKKLGKLDNHRQEPWKLPLKEFFADLYLKRFGRTQPERVLSIEQRAKELAQKKQAKKEQKLARRAGETVEPSPDGAMLMASPASPELAGLDCPEDAANLSDSPEASGSSSERWPFDLEEPSPLCVALRDFARSCVLPFLRGLPSFAPHQDSLCFLLIGSVATGSCRPGSDVDIAVLCPDALYRQLPRPNRDRWDIGKPTEIVLEGTQLHYFAIPIGRITARLRAFDDAWIYDYSRAIVLHDPSRLFARHVANLQADSPEVRRARLEGKLDMLTCRQNALPAIIANGDILVSARVCLELISLCAKVCALIDNVPFTPRKRFFEAALAGSLGSELARPIRDLVGRIGELGGLGAAAAPQVFSFPPALREIVDLLAQRASSMGFRVGLNAPDHRHDEM